MVVVSKKDHIHRVIIRNEKPWLHSLYFLESMVKAELWNSGFMGENVVSISRWNDRKLDSWKEEQFERIRRKTVLLFFILLSIYGKMVTCNFLRIWGQV